MTATLDDTGLTERIGCELVERLHRAAPPEEFAALLAEAEHVEEGDPRRSGLVELVRMAMAVRNRLDLWQQREAGMLAVIESARDLSSRLDLEGLLRMIVVRARTMLGSQLAWLSTYDPAASEFHVQATDGALAQGTQHMAASRGLGIVSVVMGTRLPFATPDYLHETRFPHDATLDATFRDEGIAAVVGVPLLWEDEVIGLLFVADRYQRTHTAQNISILSTLATHAAVAIKNAKAFEQARAALASAESARAQLERHVRSIQSAAEAHERMTSLLAGGATLATICQAMAQLLGGNVLVTDEAAQVIGRGQAIGYEGPGAHAYVPHGADSSALASALRRSREIGRSVVAGDAAGEWCRVSAVLGGKDVLGAVLLFGRGELDEVAVRTFERCASIVGVVLLSREREEATHSREQSMLLRALVAPRQHDLPLLRQRAEAFGLDLAQPVAWLLVEMEEPGPSYLARQLRARKLLARAVFDEIDGVLVILCLATAAEDVRRVVADLARHHVGAGFRGVLSRPATSPERLPDLHAALRRALPVLRRIGVRTQIVGQNEMALYATLFETHDQASLGEFLESAIGSLLAHDEKKGSELAATLLAYFDCNQNAKAAAERLGLHVNTIRQRLATIEDLLGHWGSATRALELHMALRLWNLGGGSLPAGRRPA